MARYDECMVNRRLASDCSVPGGGWLLGQDKVYQCQKVCARPPDAGASPLPLGVKVLGHDHPRPGRHDQAAQDLRKYVPDV